MKSVMIRKDIKGLTNSNAESNTHSEIGEEFALPSLRIQLRQPERHGAKTASVVPPSPQESRAITYHHNPLFTRTIAHIFCENEDKCCFPVLLTAWLIAKGCDQSLHRIPPASSVAVSPRSLKLPTTPRYQFFPGLLATILSLSFPFGRNAVEKNITCGCGQS
uniref:Uncharacterized protein n=1 Tax=Physcomitrium patens TaxID=3218 RepID=A0A2K1JGN9_PHYPA|nr:hypothetical protein PHYPA_018120 [Physcomitrium patens]